MLALATQPHWLGLPLAYWWLLGIVFGGGTGSFLALAIERIPHGIPLTGRSRCVCGRQLLWWENIPVLSWGALRGRARCCRTRIPAGYVLTETATTLVWVACFSLPSMWLGIPAAIGASLLVLGVSVQVSRFRIGRHSTSATATGPLAQ